LKFAGLLVISCLLTFILFVIFDTHQVGDPLPEYSPCIRSLNLGISSLLPINVPAEDRNRTSPFPYGGHRFEFRALGSSQNPALVNTILSTTVAQSFKQFSDFLENEENIQKYLKDDDRQSAVVCAAHEYLQDSLRKHWHVIFNGNGYDAENQAMLTDRKVWRIDDGIDAIKTFSSPKNIELFAECRVLAKDELLAREMVLLDHYTGLVEIEASCLVDILQQHVLPAVRNSGLSDDIATTLNQDVITIKEAIEVLVAKVRFRQLS
jgi:glutamine synthetase